MRLGAEGRRLRASWDLLRRVVVAAVAAALSKHSGGFSEQEELGGKYTS